MAPCCSVQTPGAIHGPRRLQRRRKASAALNIERLLRPQATSAEKRNAASPQNATNRCRCLERCMAVRWIHSLHRPPPTRHAAGPQQVGGIHAA